LPIERVHHVGIVVSDIAPVHELLTKAFGFERTREFESPSGACGAFYKLREFEVELVQYPDGELRDRRLQGQAARIEHIALQVSELASTLGGLRACGFAAEGDKVVTEEGTYLRSDPESTAGFCVQLFEPAADTGQAAL
jgi:catechol 2,3-dioxygenase-like lactoylglutathione lyase family enzyme